MTRKSKENKIKIHHIMRPKNLVKILKKYTSGWVSISQDNNRIIAHGRNLKSLLKKLDKMGNPKGYLMKAARNYSGYVGS